MIIFTKISQINKFLTGIAQKGSSIGFVPTMGALHQGHLTLIRKANDENDVSVCSIFVNPTQFNNPEDLKKYPRLIEKDMLLLEKSGCDVLFYPNADEMYGKDEGLLDVDLLGIDKRLEGEHRPGHFNGVATIVKKLFDAVAPHKAYFGQKDYQQVLVVKTMVKQLNVPIEIIAVPTVREESGLAMSSRNLRLTNEERENAAEIYRVLVWAKENLTKLDAGEIEKVAGERLAKIPGAAVEYFELADGETLAPLVEYKTGQKVVALTAVQVGAVRLIDNMEIA
ncbi:MAG: pantoate--beta-alanine ligase [Bacteroidota bacterium]